MEDDEGMECFGVFDAEIIGTLSCDKSGETRPARSRRACTACRSRKVRCDVLRAGAPCTNCRIGDLCCAMVPRKRPKYPHRYDKPPGPACAQISLNRKRRAAKLGKSPEGSSPSDCFSEDVLEREPVENVVNPSSSLEIGEASFGPFSASLRSPVLLPDVVNTPGQALQATENEIMLPWEDTEENVRSEQRNSYLPVDLSYHNEFFNSAVDPISGKTLSQIIAGKRPTRQPVAALQESDQSALMFHSDAASDADPPWMLHSCCQFIDSQGLWQLSPSEAAFLEQQGSFHVPSRALMNEFLKQYFRIVHPILPLIDEGAFWASYFHPSGRDIPLLLLYAMLFASCPYVSLPELKKLGFPGVKEARSQLYSRTKVCSVLPDTRLTLADGLKALFDLTCQRDNIIKAQAALLMTYYSPEGDHMINSYWLSTAVHFARSERADKYHLPSHQSGNSQTLKRLWWCCILRDRIMALSLRRPVNIHADEFDFGQPGLERSDFQNELECQSVYERETKQVLVHISSALCQLVVIFDKVFAVLRHGSSTTSSVGASEGMIQEGTLCLEMLDLWYETSKATVKSPAEISEGHRFVTLFMKMIYIYYFVAKASICHHALLLSVKANNGLFPPGEHQVRSRFNMDHSLRGITESVLELNRLDLTRYLPNTFITFLALPFTWHILETQMMKGTSKSQEAPRIMKAYTSVMRSFRSTYESADSTLQCIQKAVEYLKTTESVGKGLMHAPKSAHPLLRDAVFPRSSHDENEERQEASGNAWADLVVYEPQSYMRIAMVVEYSLAQIKLLHVV
uniref:Zn(2)-C6 fungal-type domain-containing protein n=1 Tax=Bionectria ochroleuca TaxID=29856 RepID=A0A0B7KCW3_BIOOC